METLQKTYNVGGRHNGCSAAFLHVTVFDGRAVPQLFFFFLGTKKEAQEMGGD